MPAYPLSRQSALKKNKPYYRTGKVCSNGHVSIRYSNNGRCVKCDDEIYKKNRYESIKTRTPNWTNLEMIRSIYDEKKKLGREYHVDHIIPLHGRFVSGLHVPENLRIIKRTENLKKGNNFLGECL